jgi:shikimate kinase
MIFLIGFMGSGKTWYGQRLATAQGVAFIDLDQYIEEQSEQTIAELFASMGETAFRDLETACLTQICHQYHEQEVVVSTGGGTPCFNDNLALMRANGRIVWVKASIATIVTRLLPERAHRPLLAQVPEAELPHFIEHILAKRLFFYEQADEIVLNE